MSVAKAITAALGGRWYGCYGTACCPTHDDQKPSLSISNGDDGRLLLHCHSGCEFSEIAAALRGSHLLERSETASTSHPCRIEQREVGERAEAEKKAKQALRLWRETLPIVGTAAENYLRARGIVCGLPKTLRFHPRCWHPSTKLLPAMVALVEGANHPAVHRTYLLRNGSSKADIQPNRAMLGRVSGGCARLVQADGPLVVAEGIETALSLACGFLQGPSAIWAALSASNLKALRLPGPAGRLIIATDGDPPGLEAGISLANHAAALGWEVSTLPAPDGEDWNDVLKRKRNS